MSKQHNNEHFPDEQVTLQTLSYALFTITRGHPSSVMAAHKTVTSGSIEQTHGQSTLNRMYLGGIEFLKAKFNRSGSLHYTCPDIRLGMLLSLLVHRSAQHARFLCTFSSEKWLSFDGCLPLFNMSVRNALFPGIVEL